MIETGPDTDDEEAPCTFAYDQALFCNGHNCWDSEYKGWGIKDVRSLFELFVNGTEKIAVIYETLRRDPGYDIEKAQQFAEELLTEFELRQAIGRSKMIKGTVEPFMHETRVPGTTGRILQAA